MISRIYIKLVFAGMLIGLFSCSSDNTLIKIGLVADPQYEDRATAGQRHYRESILKLAEAVDSFNYYKVDLVQNLGDIINSGIESFDSIMPVYKKLGEEIESYHLLGNHEFAVDSANMHEILGRLSMPDYYYSYEREGWRFVVMNSMDYSFLANPLFRRDTNLVNYYYKKSEGRRNHYDWNGAIGREQLDWLDRELTMAEEARQKVIVFAHMPLFPEDVEERLWNSESVVEIIEKHDCVVAHINGHRHKGAYELVNGVHYISIFGMVDTEISSYGILNIYKDSVILEGFGHQEDIILLK